jgi:acid phosphatase
LVVGYAARDEAPRPNPQERSLDANLWLQTSGEFHALCLQTYRLAGEKLARRLADWPGPPARPPAVVLDLDETVFDNAPFQTWLYRYGVGFSPQRWEVWERDHADEVRLVPGARDFIRGAEGAGVTVFYLSNRLKKHRAATVSALARLGLHTATIDQRLLLAASATDTDKTERRRQVEARYSVLMSLGDNLRDFSEEFRAPRIAPDDGAGQKTAIAARKRRVEAHARRWGDEWFVLPNPAYGEWTKLCGRPLENLAATEMPPPR